MRATFSISGTVAIRSSPEMAGTGAFFTGSIFIAMVPPVAIRRTTGRLEAGPCCGGDCAPGFSACAAAPQRRNAGGQATVKRMARPPSSLSAPLLHLAAMAFKLRSDYKPQGDQPRAIAELTAGIRRGDKNQTLLGVTGSGKTFSVANVVAQVQRPTLVIAHNKTLAAQLYGEFKDLFPENAVEYFDSYFDYYQPEAYIARSDTYIEKDSSINDEIERMRHSATRSLRTRSDVIIVASVSCIYGLGTARSYVSMAVPARTGEDLGRDKLIRALIEAQYERNDLDFHRGTFRVRGDTVE